MFALDGTRGPCYEDVGLHAAVRWSKHVGGGDQIAIQRVVIGREVRAGLSRFCVVFGFDRSRALAILARL